jgi:hypothetical protein
MPPINPLLHGLYLDTITSLPLNLRHYLFSLTQLLVSIGFLILEHLHMSLRILMPSHSIPYTVDQISYGSGILLTASYPLFLHNLLHVPQISKPLISISQLVTDNNIYVEFNHSFCLVKDVKTHQVLLQGIKYDGLYLITSAPSHALLCEVFTSSLTP